MCLLVQQDEQVSIELFKGQYICPITQDLTISWLFNRLAQHPDNPSLHPEAVEFDNVEPPDEGNEALPVQNETSDSQSQALISLKTLEILQRMEAKMDG